MTLQEIRKKLMDKGLRVTPQRIAILEAIDTLRNHPTAEQVIDYIRANHPNIATGTVYKVLETLTGHMIINRVKTDRDIMRYDADTENHHHLYCTGSDRIADYYDDQLNKIVEEYCKTISIPGFVIRDVKLQIIGEFLDRGDETTKNHSTGKVSN